MLVETVLKLSNFTSCILAKTVIKIANYTSSMLAEMLTS
jgi:hypothetical protein